MKYDLNLHPMTTLNPKTTKSNNIKRKVRSRSRETKALERGQPEQQTHLWRKEYTVRVDNLPLDIDSYLLGKAFSEFGQIESCRVVLDQNWFSLGYGLVQFSS